MNPKFVDELPSSKQGSHATTRPKHYRTALILKKHPGQWAHIMEDRAAVTATLIKKGTLVAFQPAGSFEAVSRKNSKTQGKNKGKSDIYARYIGEPQTDEQAEA